MDEPTPPPPTRFSGFLGGDWVGAAIAAGAGFGAMLVLAFVTGLVFTADGGTMPFGTGFVTGALTLVAMAAGGDLCAESGGFGVGAASRRAARSRSGACSSDRYGRCSSSS